MPRVSVRVKLSSSQKATLLKLFESIGKRYIVNYMHQNLLYPLSSQQLQDKEFLLRFLLLVATLDQQADSMSARNTVIQLYAEYGQDLFFHPENYIGKLYDLVEVVKRYYKPKTRVLRIKTEGLALLRVGGYLLTLLNISQKYGSLLNHLLKNNSPKELLKSILKDSLIKGLLYEKAARMYTGWVSHPDLWINVSASKWRVQDIPMVVNGHVCKTLVRTGFLPDVLVESVDTMIVKAENERTRIEREVKRLYPDGDYFMIDCGAFYVGINYSNERSPKRNICPIMNVCAENMSSEPIRNDFMVKSFKISNPTGAIFKFAKTSEHFLCKLFVSWYRSPIVLQNLFVA